MMENNEYMLKIYRNKKPVIVASVLAGVLFMVSVVFLYLGFSTANSVYHWTAGMLIVIGLLTVFSIFQFLYNPILTASGTGLWLSTNYFGGRVFIPWVGIKKVEIELRSSIVSDELPNKECLKFELNGEYLHKVPMFINGGLRLGSRIYFSDLSLPQELVCRKLIDLRKKRAEYDLGQIKKHD